MGRWPLSALLLVLSLSGVPLAASTQQDAADDYFAPTGDLVEARRLAQQGGKVGVAVLFEMAECGECARLRAETLSAAPVRDYFRRHFITVSLRADAALPLSTFTGQATTQSEFARHERVVGLPTLVLYDLDAVPVARLAGRQPNPDLWLRLGRYVVAGGYEETPFAAWRPVD